MDLPQKEKKGKLLVVKNNYLKSEVYYCSIFFNIFFSYTNYYR